jgi:toxin ParE1/3/4
LKAIVWSTRASKDYLNVLHYISRTDPIAAEQVADRVLTAVASLTDMSTGRPGRQPKVREKLVRGLPYLIFYTLDPPARPTRIVILRIWHTSRDWPRED